MLAFEVQWNLSIAGTIGTSKKMSSIERCPPHRGFAQIGTFTSNTAPKCIRTAQPYSPIGLPLLKLVKSMDQRHCVITTLYI